MKRIVILGSTGSIGRNALDVISRHRDRFKVAGLSAGSNIDLLEEQINIFKPPVVAVADGKSAGELRRRIAKGTEVLSGEEGINTVAAYKESDFVLSSIVGFSGLVPTLSAVRAGKVVGLANKESLVTAGPIVMKEAEQYGSKILPVDSEHSAIFQCVDGRDRGFLKRVILTASGGPFVGKKSGELKDVKPADALNHPNWKMGRKVTIDSATLMNKGLEVIEAAHLFSLAADRIAVLVHPESILHSLVEFTDNTMLAQMSVPDMRGPISYALSYPERLNSTVARLELEMIGKLTFYPPDTESFPCLKYAFDALKEGGTMPAVLNAANEVAVNAFLDKRVSFNTIPVIIEKTMNSHDTKRDNQLDSVIEADRWARKKAEEYVHEYSK
ncbi:MAG: 1-deoxy-D-xylulose-5-phosphate reductoisomerase [Nitrospirota bacterium]